MVVLEEHGLVKWLKLWTPGTRNMSILTLTILMNRRQVMVIYGMIAFYFKKRIHAIRHFKIFILFINRVLLTLP